MRSKRAAFLVFTALVTSAAVMELRLNTLDTAPQPATQAMSCNAVRQSDVVPAACESTQNEQRVERATPQPRRGSALWV